MNLQNRIRLLLGQMDDVVLWRNHVAAFEVEGRFQRSGMVKGSADLIGIVAPYGRMLAIEVKEGSGRPSKEQKLFLALVNKMGGVGIVARTEQEAEQAAEQARHLPAGARDR